MGWRSPRMLAYTRGMSTTTPANPSHPNATEGEMAPSPPMRTVYTSRGGRSHPMPIYLGAKNTPTAGPLAPAPTPAPTRPSEAPLTHHKTEAGSTQAYDPASLLRQLLALLGVLLGLTLWLGGWQPHTSDARLGWSHGTIDVVEGTDGDTGSRPLSPNDSGIRPAPNHPPVDTVYSGQGSRPVDLPRTFFEGSGPGGTSVNPPPSGSQA